MSKDSVIVSNKRLLGVIRFFDQAKGFGFIDTNGYGIYDNVSGGDPQFVELFFCQKNTKQVLSEGMWVTFVFKKSNHGKRDIADSVKRLRCTEEELVLALQYNTVYSDMCIENSRTTVKVIANALSYLLYYNANQSYRVRLVYNTLLEAYKNGYIGIPELAEYDSLIDLAISPETLIPTQEGLESHDVLLPDLSVFLLEQAFFDNEDYWRKRFEVCLLHLNPEGLKQLLELICSQYYNALNEKTPFIYDIDDYLSKLPADHARKLCDSGTITPETRILIYRILSDESVLLHESMITYWNKRSLTDEDPFYYIKHRSLYSETIRLPHCIGGYIATSSLSSDYLLLISFIETGDLECFNHIKDFSIIYSWLPNLSDNTVHSFLSHFKIIPQSILTDFFLLIGSNRIARIASSYGDLFVKTVPECIKVDLRVVISQKSEEQVTEDSDWYGGHFTWGEGVKHRKCDLNTYLVKHFIASVYCEAKRSELTTYFRYKYKKTLEDQIIKCVEKKRSSSVFSCSIKGEDLLVCISVQDFDSAISVLIFEQQLKAKFLLSTKVIYED